MYKITPELKGRTNGYTLPKFITFSSFLEEHANKFVVCEAYTKLAAKVYICLPEARDQKKCHSDDWALVRMDYWTKELPLDDDLCYRGEY